MAIWKANSPRTSPTGAESSPGVGVTTRTISTVSANSNTTTTSIRITTESATVVNGPYAFSSVTTAMADEGERATARHAMKRQTRSTSFGWLAVSESHGDAKKKPVKTKQ